MQMPWRRHEDDLRRELEHHMAELTDEYIRQGHSKTEAREMAARQFGGSELIKDQCRDESPWAWLQSLAQDLRFGLRQLKQTPVVTAAAVLSLALGIGANSAIISLMNTVLWRSLPVSAPEQMSLLHWQGPRFPNHLADAGAGSMYRDGATSVANFFPMIGLKAMQNAAAGKAQIAPYSMSPAASISFEGRPVIAYNRPVGGAFFDVLKLQPMLGRTFRMEDDTASAAPVAIVSHRFYRNVLASDAQVLGKTLRINNAPYEIIGVLPDWFYGLVAGDATDIYSPIHKSSEFAKARRGNIDFENPRAWVVQAIVRRADGVSQSDLQPILSAAFQQTWERKATKRGNDVDPALVLHDGQRGLGDLSRTFKNPLLVLGSLLALVLLIACANIANLLLARATARAKEVALRISLGCTRSRLLRQLLTESALLSLLGGAASILVAYGSAKGLAYFVSSRDNTGPLPLTVDLPMIAAIAVISILTLLLFGLFPAWRASRVDTASALKEGSGSLGVAARRWWTPGKLLIVAQMSLAIILVSAAVLFAENLRSLATQNVGFERGNLLVFSLRPGTSGYTETTLPAFYHQLEQQLASTSGVDKAALATIRPMNQGGWWDDIREIGKPRNYSVAINRITPSYLPIFSGGMRAGRNFTIHDSLPNAAKVAIVSEDLARMLEPNGNVVGLKIHQSGDPNAKIEPMEIVGVVPAFAFNSMKERPQVLWLPFDPKSADVTVVLRTKGSPRGLLQTAQESIGKIDRNLPLADPFTMEELIERNLQRERMFATLCGAFGVLALLLSVIGLYGVMSYNATRRKTEIGVRLALGAERSNVIWMVLREALLLTAAGLLLGAPAIYFGSTYVEKELFGMKPLNPYVLTISVLVLALAAGFAAAIPARRAASLDPASALRQD